MAEWPSELPAPLIDSVVMTPRGNVLAFQPDVGPAIMRRRSTTRLIDYVASLSLNDAQRVILDNFHHDDCQDGALSFTMADWLTGQPVTMQWQKPPSFEQRGRRDRWIAAVALVRIA